MSDNWRELVALLDNRFAGTDRQRDYALQRRRGLNFSRNTISKLAKRYILDDSIPDVHLTMLNKRRTMEKARDIGIPVPQICRGRFGSGHRQNRSHDIMFPTIVKPQHSHLFQKAFNGEKLFFADNWDSAHALDRRLPNSKK